MAAPLRFRFDAFVLSPRQRVLLRDGMTVPLIPRYFDLLRLLVERRRDAVSKETIFAEVWSDVIVSDGALSQAIRTLRRALGDSPREPRFIRTVSRHGYQFIYAAVVEEPDEPIDAPPRQVGLADGEGLASPSARVGLSDAAELGRLVDRLLTTTADPAGLQEARDAAERLHALGTAAAIAEIARRPRHAMALAILRDARWTVPEAGRVPLDAGATAALVRLRLADAGRTIARRWAGAATAGALVGTAAGLVGGLALAAAPASTARLQSALALAAIGALAGGVGGAGIGAGLASAEALARSRRGLALVVCGAVAGVMVAGLSRVVLRALLDGLLGVRGAVDPGPIEGLVIGGTVGLGYAVATRQPPGGGLAAPGGSRRLLAAAVVGLFTAGGAVALGLAGRTLIGGLVNDIARLAPDAQLAMAPLGRLLGEPDFGPVTRILLGALEGGAFGGAVAWGLTRRPRESRINH